MTRREYFPEAVIFFDVTAIIGGQEFSGAATFRSRKAAEAWIAKREKPASGVTYRIEESKRNWRTA